MTPLTVDEAVGQRLKVLRGDLSHEMVAVRLRQAGLKWTRSQLAQIEAGRRSIQLGEWLVLPMALSYAFGREDTPLTYHDLIPEDLGAVTITERLTALHGILPFLLKAHGQIRQAKPHSTDPYCDYFRRVPTNEKAYQEDVSWNAARKLKVGRDSVIEAAQRLWGSSISAERDRRVGALQHTSRTIQALRVHVSRTLFQELKAQLITMGVLKKGGHKRQKRK